MTAPQLSATNGRASALAVRVNRARDELLAGAALAVNEDRRGRVGGMRDLLVDRRASPAVRPRMPFRRQRRRVWRRRRRRARACASARSTARLHFRDVERLADVVERARAHRLHRGVERAESADQEDLAGRVGVLERLQHVQARLGAVEVDVRDDQVEGLAARPLDRVRGSLRLVQLALRAPPPAPRSGGTSPNHRRRSGCARAMLPVMTV